MEEVETFRFGISQTQSDLAVSVGSPSIVPVRILDQDDGKSTPKQ